MQLTAKRGVFFSWFQQQGSDCLQFFSGPSGFSKNVSASRYFTFFDERNHESIDFGIFQRNAQRAAAERRNEVSTGFKMQQHFAPFVSKTKHHRYSLIDRQRLHPVIKQAPGR